MAKARRRTRKARRPRPTWPAVVLAVLTVVVSAAGWWIFVRRDPSEDLGPAFAFGSGAFAGAAFVSSVWRLTTRPGGVAAQFAAVGRLRRTDGVATTGAALAWPPRGLWALPLLQLPVLALAAPFADRESFDGVWDVVAALLFYGLLVAWVGILAEVFVWAVLLLPVFSLGRIGWQLVRRRPLTTGDRTMLVAGAVLLGILAFATGIVLGADGQPNEIVVFLGGGDQSSPWLWVGRGGLLVVVLTIVTAGWYFTRLARRASSPPARTTRRRTPAP